MCSNILFSSKILYPVFYSAPKALCELGLFYQDQGSSILLFRLMNLKITPQRPQHSQDVKNQMIRDVMGQLL